MSDESRLPKVGDNAQSSTDKFFIKKAEAIRYKQGRKVALLRNKNFLVGLGLFGAVFTIYGYTMFSVRQGKLLDDFDKVAEFNACGWRRVSSTGRLALEGLLLLIFFLAYLCCCCF